jgi:translation initiation factor eIF-2B subunit delta
MEEVQKIVSQLRRDYVHGSSWYFEKIANLIAGITKGDLKLLVDSIGSIRPGMASISNIELVLRTTRIDSDDDLRGIGKSMLDYKNRATERLISEVRKVKIKSAMSISYSSAIRAFIEGTELEELVLLESRPGNEYKVAKKDYGTICNVTVIPDSAAYAYANSVDAVVMGFDGLYSNGYLVNKIGSVPLCLSAREAGIGVYAVGESFKASRDPVGRLKEGKIGRKAPSKIPIFDQVRLSLIDRLITDTGTFSRPNREVVRSIHEFFVEGVSI